MYDPTCLYDTVNIYGEERDSFTEQPNPLGQDFKGIIHNPPCPG